MEIEKYREELIPMFKKQCVSYPNNVINQVKKIIEDNDNIEYDWEKIFSDKQNIISLFMSSKNRINLSINSIKMKKIAICKLIDLLIRDDKIIDGMKAKEIVKTINVKDLASCSMMLTYFKSLDDLLSYIDLVGKTKFSKIKRKAGYLKYDSQNDFLIIKTICILLWHGISNKEMVLIKKEDIIPDKNEVVVNGKKIELNKKEFATLNGLKFATSQRTITGGKIIELSENEFLLPRKKNWNQVKNKNSLKINDFGITNEIIAFNRIAGELGSAKIIDAPSLKMNGFLYEVYSKCNYEDNASLRKFLSSHKIRTTDITGVSQLFKVWVDKFYSLKNIV